MTLTRLHPTLVHHVVNTLGWPALRPLQEAATGPLMEGADALLLAPTAGGKTEAAMFPLLSRMATANWSGTAILYVCPLKALLNNLLPRLERYAEWIGRRVALWHGDVSGPARKRILTNRPDVLLTTPESLEAMLVSVNVDHRQFFSGLQAIVVDEVHAFAGDDRGWHLLAVLERLTRLIGRPIQRVGLSATVGNPAELLAWLQGTSTRPSLVIAPDLPSGAPTAPSGDIQLDYVGSVANAAKVIAALHQGEKRLVFCDSRQLVEELGHSLRALGITTFLSHASLSVDERRRSEAAFAEARDCVIVSTSTLELGIDVGDLDRVIQINAPDTVASFLQRLGRTGRRAGTLRNCLFLALTEDALLRAAGLLTLWGRGWVEPVTAPPEPRHIVAQQLLALCLQEHRVGDKLWRDWWNGLGPFGGAADPIVRHLVTHGFLDEDSGMLFIGPEAERRFGRRHFMEMTSVFTAVPEFTVLSGRKEVGRTDPALLTEEIEGPRLLLLGGRTWQVTYIDWRRRRCFVEPADGRGKARWNSASGLSGLSFELTRAMRAVLLGEDPPVHLTQRARDRLSAVREGASETVHPDGTVIIRDPSGEIRWWTWGGFRANATLVSTLAGAVSPGQRVEEDSLRLREDLTPEMWKRAVTGAADRLALPEVDRKALNGLKFSVALPERLAEATLAARLADLDGAAAVLHDPARWTVL
ncbi:DEAD/DEAH box helicase [Planomonospora parontospora]|uniref:DEAD/DEAH box helicase n=1 Tax=Planomonospora parontospora TaxID=58119 RepID=UPI0016706E0C|nr:DEAD/DEAH box helicase [Planomonospora parontospora]GGL15899.1 ATP-dependent helicase [Planomonospora parontospora subsp. antibiotica]GII15438.1 ATP-dependent helicase [Planomonospora parontospora subsp. antibiotica]